MRPSCSADLRRTSVGSTIFGGRPCEPECDRTTDAAAAAAHDRAPAAEIKGHDIAPFGCYIRIAWRQVAINPCREGRESI
jgi:hypothetical protein